MMTAPEHGKTVVLGPGSPGSMCESRAEQHSFLLQQENELLRRHNEYTLLCERDGVEPMGYTEWLEFDKLYQEHIRTDAITRSAELESKVGSLELKVKALEEENERLNLENEELHEAIYEQGKRTTPSNQPLFPHYFRQVPNTTHVDVYWVLKAWDVTDPCLQHSIKKLMAAGMRGAKNKTKDLQEARDSIARALELEETK